MSGSSVGAIGLAGMQRAMSDVSNHASRLSRAYTPSQTEDIDPVTEIVGMKTSEFAFQASSKLVGVQRDLDREILAIA